MVKAGDLVAVTDQYTRDFYSTRHERTLYSAETILSLVLGTLSFPVRSAVDVGCGVGSWLAVLHNKGVEDVWGIDGPWVDKGLLKVPQEQFLECDLSKPISHSRRYDLAISLEVAEHLHPDCAAEFVASLTRLSDCVLFSAAMPFQGGRGHLNEQWPSYWAELFDQHNYKPVDCIRRFIWSDDHIPYWYRQKHNAFCRTESTCEYSMRHRRRSFVVVNRASSDISF